MRTTSASLTSKGQVTVPAWVRKALNIEPKMEIVWLELEPGQIFIMGKTKENAKNPVKNLCGILKGKGKDQIQLVESLLEDRKKDQVFQERGFIE